jgi:putative oxidoreductase
MSTIAAVIGRILIGAYFVVAGAIILLAPEPADALFTSAGLVPGLALTVGLFEVIAGVALALGAMTRIMAIGLAVWTGISIAVFHGQVTQPAQVPEILMNVAVLGGLLLVFAHTQIWWSFDSMRAARRADLANFRAQDRVREAELAAARQTHDAELRAARAEGAVAASPIGTPVSSGVSTPVATSTTAPHRRWF